MANPGCLSGRGTPGVPGTEPKGKDGGGVNHGAPPPKKKTFPGESSMSEEAQRDTFPGI